MLVDLLGFFIAYFPITLGTVVQPVRMLLANWTLTHPVMKAFYCFG